MNIYNEHLQLSIFMIDFSVLLKMQNIKTLIIIKNHNLS